MSTVTANEKHPLAGKTIVIAGAGVAGLAFARGFTDFWSKNNPSQPQPQLKIYERDPRHLPADRGNYSLGLRSDADGPGLQALRTLGLLDHIIAAGLPNSSQGAKFRDHNWEPVGHFAAPNPPPDGLPIASMRISRNAIRETMLRGLEGRSVEVYWEAQCVDVRKRGEDGDGKKGMRIVVSRGDGSHWEEVVDCDLLVVADGASSKIRGLLRPHDGLDFAGATFTCGNAFFKPGQLPAAVQKGFGPVVGSGGNPVFVYPIDDCSAVWFSSTRTKCPQTPVSGKRAFEMKDQIIADVRARTAAFGSTFEQLLQATDPHSLKVFNAQDKKPVTHDHIEWEPVIYIGDASHAVSPFAGNGLNLALVDGVSLSKRLCERNAKAIPEIVRDFDAETVPRCLKVLKTSHVILRVAHASGIFLWLLKTVLRVMTRWSKK